MLRVCLVIAAAGALCACTQVGPSREGTLYFGLVRVSASNTDKNVASSGEILATDTSGVGLKFGDGFGAGYFHDQRYVASPDCRVLFLVRTQEQLNEITKRLANFKEGICAAVKS